MNPDKCSQEELSVLPSSGRNVKGKDTALVFAIPQDIYTSPTVQVRLCPPWNSDFTPDTAAQALQALTCCSEGTKVVSEYTCNSFQDNKWWEKQPRRCLCCKERSPEGEFFVVIFGLFNTQIYGHEIRFVFCTPQLYNPGCSAPSLSSNCPGLMVALASQGEAEHENCPCAGVCVRKTSFTQPGDTQLHLVKNDIHNSAANLDLRGCSASETQENQSDWDTTA